MGILVSLCGIYVHESVKVGQNQPVATAMLVVAMW